MQRKLSNLLSTSNKYYQEQDDAENLNDEAQETIKIIRTIEEKIIIHVRNAHEKWCLYFR